jgi:hypothetical protein
MQVISFQEYQVVLSPERVALIKEHGDMVWQSKYYAFRYLCMSSSRLSRSIL